MQPHQPNQSKYKPTKLTQLEFKEMRLDWVLRVGLELLTQLELSQIGLGSNWLFFNSD